jgi:integrase/recombinase XerC
MIGIEGGKMKLKDALNRFLLEDRAPSTALTYRRFLSRFVAAIGPERQLSQVTSDDVAQYITEMSERQTKYETHPQRPVEREPLSRATVYKNKKMIKAFFNWCVQQGYLKSSPAHSVRNRKPQIVLGQGKAATPEEVAAILDAARFHVRDHAIVLLLARGAPRAHEIAGLRLGDLELDSHSAIVNGKGSKRRRIYFDAETADAIRLWLEARPKAARHSFVFTSLHGSGPLKPPSISEITERLSDKAGLRRRLGAHSFRHYLGTELVRLGVPLVVIQSILGHSSSNITAEYYQNVDVADIRVAIRRLAESTPGAAPTKHPKIVHVDFRKLG